MKYHRTLHCLVLAAFVMPAALSDAAHAQTTIVLRPQQSRGPISPFIYGTNQRYNNNASGTWDAAQKKMVPAFDRNHREAGLKSMRYPGGTVASTFEWKNAIGPLEKRRKIQPAQGLKAGGGGPQIATWGVDEAARWCETNKVELVYMYGIGAPNSNPADAADLVEYLNAPVGKNPNGGTDWAKVRAKNGHPAPYNIHFFEIANEADGPNTVQRYWLDAVDTDENRAKRKLPMQPQRHSYAPEYCFGGIIRYEKQPVTQGDDLRDSSGAANGLPNLRRIIRYYPVLPESVEVFVGGQKWESVPDISRAPAAGQVYQLNAATGEIRFGDGTHGDIPPKGTQITVTYRAPRAGFVDYYPVMKAVDPNIRIFAGFESPNIIRTLGDKHLYDGIVVHPYTNEYNVPKARTMDEWYQNQMLSGARLGREIRAYQNLIDKTVAPARRGQVRVICTEYGPLRQDQVLPDGAGSAPVNRLLSTGLYDATQLMNWMRVQMPHAQRHATTVGVFGPPPDFEPSPSALAFGLFTHHFGDQLIGFDLKNNPVRPTDKVETHTQFYSGAIRRIGSPDLPVDAKPLALPKLECEASRDAQGNVYLMVINQDAADDVSANLEIAGRKAGGGTVEVWTLNGPTATAFNTPQMPDAVKIVAANLSESGAGPLQHTFPAHSLTAIKFSAK